MRLLKLRTRGLVALPNEQEIVFPDKRIIAIVGDNGAGKTSWLDMIPVALFGTAPNRPKSLYDCFVGIDAMVDLTFELHGQVYRARRLINANSRTQKVFFYHGDSPMTEGKTAEFDGAIAHHLGLSEGAFLASVYSAQNGRGNPLSLDDKGRRDLLTEVLGLNRFDAPYLKASNAVTAAENQVNILDAQRLQLSSLFTDIEGLEKNWATNQTRIIEFETQIAAREAELTAIKEKIAQAKANNQHVDELKRQSSLLAVSIDQDQKTIDEKLEKINQNQVELIDKEEAILKAVEQTKVLKQNIEVKECYRKDLQDTIEKLDREHLEKHTALSQQKALLMAQYEAVRTSNQNEKNQEMALKSKIESYTLNNRTLENQANVIDRVPCQKDPIPTDSQLAMMSCPLLAQGKAASASLTHNEGQIKAWEVELATLQIDSSEEIKKQQVSAKEAEISALMGQSPTLKQRQELTAVDGALNQIKAEIKELEPLVNYHPYLQGVQERMQGYKDEIANIESRLQSDKQAHDVLQTSIEESIHLVETLNRETLHMAGTEEELKPIRNQWSEALSMAGALENMIKTAKETQAQMAELNTEITSKRTRLSDLIILKDALGPKGIKALKIDAAGPEISELLNALLMECYGAKFSIAIKTLRELQNKELREAMEFSIIDNTTGMDANVELKSGGEQQIIREIISLSLCIYQKRRTGISSQTLIRDEACSALSEENSVKYIQMLDRALTLGGFNQVLFVSHKSCSQALADAVIEVKNGKVTIL